MKKGKLINRKTYNKVRKMDRQEMEDFLTSIYKTGYSDGVEANKQVDFKIRLIEVLENTKGVGPKTFNRIMKAAKEMGI